MSPEQQLAYEARNRTRQVAFAVAGGVLLMLASIIGLLGPHSPVSEETLNLLTEHQRAGYDIAATILNSVAELSFGVTLWYLWRCTRSRSEKSFAYVPVIVIVGVVVAAVTDLIYVVDFTHIASQFATTGAQTYDQANRLESSNLIAICKILGQLAALLIAISFVLVSLQAMRIGLLPRFLGYVGMLSGFLFLFPITVVPVVQLFWLLAVAILISGRWPDGLPEAWKTGRAVPLPSAAETRARRAAEAEAARNRRAARQRGEHRQAVSDAPPPETAAATAAQASKSARKRKRKHRH
ncbi:MAG TPA: DUF4386 family protein [Solirubrobacteraceae bacterium]|nr:DUF4386 family protein [Solirubrobacteraceae bacterium]